MDSQLLTEGRQVAKLLSWRMQMTIPSILAEGERFSLCIALTVPDGLPAADGDLEVRFEGSPGVEGLPAAAKLSPQSGGIVEIANLTAVGPHAAMVRAKVQGLEVVSNPSWIFAAPARRLYWGDLHVHTTYSDCCAWSCKSPEFGYAYAQEVSHLDFAAAADHLRGIAADACRWPRLQELARAYHRPGRFVALLAFESSHKTGLGGDNNAYLLDDRSPHFWLDRPDMKGNNPAVELEELWRFLDTAQGDYFTVPHHTGRAFKYRAFDGATYDATRERLFEIYSAWGSSERAVTPFPLYGGNTDQPAYFVDALAAGCRYGVICSSDDHTTMPGGETGNWGVPRLGQSNSGYRHKGLAAVWAERLDRASLWEALKSRRTYGTTFDRSLVDVRLGDLAMGQEARLDRSDPLRRSRDIRVRVSMAQLAGGVAALVRNGEVLDRQPIPGNQPVAELVFHDATDLEAAAVRTARFHPGPFVSYYVRIHNSRNETQWTSPIWLDL